MDNGQGVEKLDNARSGPPYLSVEAEGFIEPFEYPVADPEGTVGAGLEPLEQTDVKGGA